jgi:hypothetical protein
MAAALAWSLIYILSLTLFVVLGTRDPDPARRALVWPMAGSFVVLVGLAEVRTLVMEHYFVAVGPGIGAWLVLSSLIASKGRPNVLAVATPLDPLREEATASDTAGAIRARQTALWLFFGGWAVAAVVWWSVLK